MQASRALRLIALSLGLTAAGAAGAQTPSLVVDAATGKVLHAEKATDPWFPASVTKLMTAYVALREVREGRARMDEVLTLSEGAAAMPPSKMGFKPGTEITLDNALKIIMVKSANDVSVAIAEGLGGSVEGFADMMNVQAQRLGMRESRFVNPHGLTDERQQTSARDMAVLARALMLEFPEHDQLFRLDSIRFGKRVMRNHNGLMGRYPGADGMKTGFICASGFNVVASATQNGRRLITVVFGSRNGNERTLKAADLFDRGFASSPGMFAPTLASLPPSTVAAPFNMRPVICERGGAMPGEDDSPTGENVAAASAVPSLTAPVNAMAFAGTGVPAVQRTVLGPRAPLNPTPVWIGRTPPPVAEPTVAERPRPAREPRPAVAAAGEPAAVATPPAPRRPAPKAQQAAVETKPKPAAPKPAAAKPAAPKPVAASPAPKKPDAKPATAKPEPKRAEAKPAVAKPEAKPAAAKPAPKAAAKPAVKPKADD